MPSSGTEAQARRTPCAEDAMVAEVVRRLVEAYRPERVYLFGSVARGEANRDSDYDILVVVPEGAPRALREGRLGYQALADLCVSVDIVVYSASGFYGRLALKASLPSSVVREGRLLYGG